MLCNRSSVHKHTVQDAEQKAQLQAEQTERVLQIQADESCVRVMFVQQHAHRVDERIAASMFQHHLQVQNALL